MIKILFFSQGLSAGGAEKVLCNLVNNMDQKKFDITVQTIDKYDPRQYLDEGIHYKVVNHCKTALGKRLFSYWFRLCAELKLAYRFFVKDNYDIEVAYLETGSTKIIAQSTNKKAAKIAWVHCDLSQKEGVDTAVDKIKKQYRQYDKIVCVSEDVKRGFYKLFGTDFDIEVLYNVIDEEEIFVKAEQSIEWHRDPDEMQLLAVGRLAPQKNFSYLIDTCKRLRLDGYQFHLNILGEGPERENLEKQIQTLGLEDTVTLRGFTNNPYPWMKQSDIIVCSSKYEGISTVVQEALILGKTVITTPCAGMAELLGASEFGVIAEDSDVGLYNCLKSMIESSDLVLKYQKLSAKRGTQLKKTQVLNNTQRMFLECVEGLRKS